MSTSIQDLDRIFADHFKVNPLIAKANDSTKKDGQRQSSQSNRSSNDDDEAITPTYPPIDLPVSSQEMLDDPVRALKLKQLYENIAELYVDKQASQKVELKMEEEQIEFLTQRSRQPSAMTITLEPRTASVYHDGEGDDQTPELSPSSTKGMTLSQTEPDLSALTRSEVAEERPLRGRKSLNGLGLQVRPASANVESKSRLEKGKHFVREGSPQVNSRPLSFPHSIAQPEDKRVLLPLEEITFKAIQLPDDGISEYDAKILLDKSFPHLCEVPTHMVGENGELLPPTKKEETSLEERQARKEALVLHFRGKKMHSLIKSVVILESRSAVWKRVGAAQRASSASRELPTIPDPWNLECYHQDLDKLAHDGKAKRAFELKGSRTEGLCTTCHGKGVDTCSTCKGEEADECWWCSGTGKKKNLRACERCVGEGKLKCQACSGKLVRPCEPCKGEGNGLFAAMVHIKVRRVEFPPVPTSIVVFGGNVQDPDAIRTAAVERTKEMIDRLIATNDARGKTPFRPLTASCSWESSSSTLLEVEVCQTSKLLSKKPSMHIGLRRTNSMSSKHKSKHTTTRFFMLPSDADLRPVELSKEEFSEALLPEIPRNMHGHREVAHDFSHSNDLPEPNGAMTPKVQAFRRIAPASIALSSCPSTPPMTPNIHTPDYEPGTGSYFESSPSRPTRSELRGHYRSNPSPQKKHAIAHSHSASLLGTPF